LSYSIQGLASNLVKKHTENLSWARKAKSHRNSNSLKSCGPICNNNTQPSTRNTRTTPEQHTLHPQHATSRNNTHFLSTIKVVSSLRVFCQTSVYSSILLLFLVNLFCFQCVASFLQKASQNRSKKEQKSYETNETPKTQRGKNSQGDE
jgi:hypothetical protein